MELWTDESLPLKLFTEYFSDDRPNGPAPLDWREIEINFGDSIYSEMLRLFTQTHFEPPEAREHWFGILQHQSDLIRALGREVSLPVAIGDYFTNVRPKLKDLVLVNIYNLIQKERFSLTDDLTGLPNRRFFSQMLGKEIENARRHHQPFSLLILDVDHFKEYNDALGHQAGDTALKELAQVFLKQARLGDHVTRYGGEEFAIILPRTNKEQAVAVADRHRQAVEDRAFFGENRAPGGKLTVTIGVSTFLDDAQDAIQLFELADEALYRGKSNGRNTVMACNPDKRAHTRYPVYMDMSVRLNEPGKKPERLAKTRNISLTGALCLSDEPLEQGRRIEAVLRSSDPGKEVRLQAQVVRLTKNNKNDSYLLGLAFRFQSENEEERLKDLISEGLQTLH